MQKLPPRPTPHQAEKAAEESVDPDRLLPGEVLDSDLSEDATHWMNVYSELLDFKTELLDRVKERLKVMDEQVAREEIERTDAKVLRAELERFRKRLHFWETRHRELT
jgi:hypothetical protein